MPRHDDWNVHRGCCCCCEAVARADDENAGTAPVTVMLGSVAVRTRLSLRDAFVPAPRDFGCVAAAVDATRWERVSSPAVGARVADALRVCEGARAGFGTTTAGAAATVPDSGPGGGATSGCGKHHERSTGSSVVRRGPASAVATRSSARAHARRNSTRTQWPRHTAWIIVAARCCCCAPSSPLLPSLLLSSSSKRRRRGRRLLASALTSGLRSLAERGVDCSSRAGCWVAALVVSAAVPGSLLRVRGTGDARSGVRVMAWISSLLSSNVGSGAAEWGRGVGSGFSAGDGGSCAMALWRSG